MTELVTKVLETDEGVVPFEEWYYSLKETKTRQVILARLARLRVGNLGDWKSLGSGVFELRIDFGPGYRVYFGRSDQTIVVLLGRGDKKSQSKDIEFAISLWETYKDAIERFERDFS